MAEAHERRIQLKRRITAKERDAIVAALLANPEDIEGIAVRFNRSVSTISKIRQKAWLSEKRAQNRRSLLRMTSAQSIREQSLASAAT